MRDEVLSPEQRELMLAMSGELPDDRVGTVEARLQSDPAARRVAETSLLLDTLFDDARVATDRRPPARSRRWIIGGAAAALAAAVLIWAWPSAGPSPVPASVITPVRAVASSAPAPVRSDAWRLETLSGPPLPAWSFGNHLDGEDHSFPEIGGGE